MKLGPVVLAFAFLGSLCAAQEFHCDVKDYKPISGVTVR